MKNRRLVSIGCFLKHKDGRRRFHFISRKLAKKGQEIYLITNRDCDFWKVTKVTKETYLGEF